MRKVVTLVSLALLLAACGVKNDPIAPSAVKQSQQDQQQTQQ
jgi:predicted small lipoprotein YifL